MDLIASFKHGKLRFSAPTNRKTPDYGNSPHNLIFLK